MKYLVITLFVLTITSCDLKSSAAYNSEAAEFEQRGDYKGAIHLLNKAIEKDPENIYAYINRAVDKSFLNDYHGAIEDYTRVIEIDPDNALAYLNRGKNKKRLEDFHGSIEDYERAIRTKGSEVFYMDKTDNSFIDTGFEFDVKMEEILYERGISRYYNDSLRIAFDDFNFCIEEGFELPTSFYWRGVIYVAFGMYDEGCSDLISNYWDG